MGMLLNRRTNLMSITTTELMTRKINPAPTKRVSDAVPRVRRLKLVVAMAIFGLALAGTVGAFGYRAMISGALLPVVPPIIKATNQPIKIAPASGAPQAKNSGNARQDGADTTGSIEKLVSREEQPVTIVPPKPTSRVISTIPITMRQNSLTRVGPPAAPAPVVTQAVPSQGMSGRAAAVADPSPQSAGQSSAGDVTAALNSAHLAAAPIPPANANSECGGNPFCFRWWLCGSSYVGAQ